MGPSSPPPLFDWPAYLDWMTKNKFNSCGCGWRTSRKPTLKLANRWYIDPSPWSRTGPGVAADGKPKYDLNSFSKAYFDRMRARVIEAGKHGIYVSVMLFQGWNIHAPDGGPNPWVYHPFNTANNVNGINGDPQSIGNGIGMHTADAPAALLEAQRPSARSSTPSTTSTTWPMRSATSLPKARCSGSIT